MHRSPSIQARAEKNEADVHQFLRENPHMRGASPGTVAYQFAKRGGRIISTDSVAKYMVSFKPNGSSAPVETPMADPPEPQPVADGEEADATAEFVPDRLVENIGTLYRAAMEVGGPEKAKSLAQTVESVGGVNNFVRAMELLMAIDIQYHTSPGFARPANGISPPPASSASAVVAGMRREGSN
jgi:hypothetical protein